MTPFRIVFFFLFLSLACLFTLPLLNVDFIPSSPSSNLTVRFQYRQAPPLVVEQDVTAPLENILSQIPELSGIYSVSNYGSGYVQLTFQDDADMNVKELEVNMLLRQARSTLPFDVRQLQASRSAADDEKKKPLMVYEFLYPETSALTANTWLTEQLLPAFNQFARIKNVELSGQKSYAWELRFNEELLERHDLSPSMILSRLREVIGRKEIGMTSDATNQMSIYYDQEFVNREDVTSISLKKGLSLGDVASPGLVEDRTRNYKRINGKNAVFISLIPYEGVNRIKLAEDIRAALENPDQFISFPPSYELQLNYDDTEYLKRELDKTWLRAGLSIGILLLLILITSRNLRYLSTLFASILVSYCLTIGLSWIFDIAIHLYSLAAITIAMGIIIDNSIILIDHLKKYRNLSILGAQLAASLTTIASMAVIFFLPKDYQGGMEDFAAMLSLSLIVSFFVSWAFSPSLHTLINKKKTGNSVRKKESGIKSRLIDFYFHLIYFLGKKRNWVIAVCILIFGLPVFLIPGHLEGQEWYNESIGSDYYQEEIRPAVNKIFGGTLRLFYQYVYESSHYRTPEKTRLYINAKLPYGHTLDQMNRIMIEVEDYLSRYPEIDKYITRVMSGRYASITIEFKEAFENGSFPYVLKGKLIQRSLDWGGVNWSVYGVGRGFSNATGGSLPGFYLTMKGYNYQDLEKHAQTLAEKLLRHKRIQEVNTNSQLSWNQSSFTTFYFEPSPASSPVDYAKVRNQLKWKSQQEYPSLFITYRRQNFPLYLVSDQSERFTLYRARYETNDNQPSLEYFGALTKTKSLDAVHKEDRQYIRGVAFDYFGSYRFGRKYLDQVLAEMEEELPAGYSIERRRWTWGNEEKQIRNILLLVVIILIFFISTIHLESFKKAVIVILMVPFSYVGIFLAFGWLDFSFDQGGYASFLMTSGLSVNAVLYLMSDIHRLKKKLPDNEALKQAITGKAWPIILTVLSTCLGLVPFLIHGEEEIFWYSFAVGTISGLLVSVLVFFILFPALLIKNK